MRFIVNYLVGKAKREATIEARNVDDAEKVANRRYKHWQDLKFANYSNAEEIYKAV